MDGVVRGINVFLSRKLSVNNVFSLSKFRCYSNKAAQSVANSNDDVTLQGRNYAVRPVRPWPDHFFCHEDFFTILCFATRGDYGSALADTENICWAEHRSGAERS